MALYILTRDFVPWKQGDIVDLDVPEGAKVASQFAPFAGPAPVPEDNPPEHDDDAARVAGLIHVLDEAEALGTKEGKS